jgi:hypothetical protein
MEGLDQLGEHQAEVVKALGELEDRIASVRFNPGDEQSIEAAISSLNEEVDRRLLPFQANSAVAEIADRLKAKAAANIRLRAEQARSPKGRDRLG